jgi:hypothetical protein
MAGGSVNILTSHVLEDDGHWTHLFKASTACGQAVATVSTIGKDFAHASALLHPLLPHVSHNTMTVVANGPSPTRKGTNVWAFAHDTRNKRVTVLEHQWLFFRNKRVHISAVL